ncbi:MAG: hypothetical protein ACM3PE_12430 [Deltaproteobacteria bacterium]
MPVKRNLVFLVVLIMLFNLSFSGCGQKSKSSPSQKPQSDASGQKPKAPKSAETILKDINTLIGELDKKNKSAKAPWMTAQTSGQQTGAGGGGNQSSNSGQGGGQGGGSTQGGTKGQSGSSQGGSGSSSSGNSSGTNANGQGTAGGKTLSREEQNNMQWQKISMSLMDIHRKWNELEPDVIDAGLPASSLEGFENALQSLTQSVSAQNTDESLTAAIDLYEQYTSGISQVFTLSTPPQLYQVEYRTMASLAAANREDWTAASDEISAALEPWGLLKAQSKNADKKLLGRCDFSLQDLKTAIDEKDLNMVMIKGDIAQANLKQLEKKLTSGGQGQQ